MKEQLELLLRYAIRMQATDIHLILNKGIMQISLRTAAGFFKIQQDVFSPRLMEYLKFISGMDLCAKWVPQSGQFIFNEVIPPISCRFSLIENKETTTGVIRLLHMQADLPIDQLTHNVKARAFLHQLTEQTQGLHISCGPTGSGKSTTLHAVLHEMAARSSMKIVSLEDPIEIPDPSYLQLEISEAAGFTYEKGIEELMRHDPDVIFIGECRSAYTAQMALRGALTGHVLLTTIHAGSGRECIHRLLEFGISKSDLKAVLKSVFAQRLYPSEHGRECVYEIWKGKDLENLLDDIENPEISLHNELKLAIHNGWVLPEAYEQGF